MINIAANISEKNSHILYSVFFFENLEKYCKAGQATCDNMAHALCMLDT
jgi:hypothetical protein